MVKNILVLLGVFVVFVISIGGTVFFLNLYQLPQKTQSIQVEQRPQTVLPTKAAKSKTYIPQLPTVSSIFSNDHDWTATLSASRVTTMIATGDVIPGRSVNYKTITYNNFNWAWEETAEFLKSADITFINLEAPLVSSCPIVNDGMIFCGDERHVEGLLFAGIDVVNLANNHAGNHGIEGVANTVSLLRKNDIVPVGVNNPVYISVGSVKFAFLGYNDIGRQAGVAHVEDETFEGDIHEAMQNADVVVVQPHWGVEYTHAPTDRQVAIAHRMIDAGADIIVGNHPHWTQPVEIYKDGLIVYAHGNFIFDQMWSEKTKEGVVGRYIFYDDQLVDIEFFPTYIEDYGRARFVVGAHADRILTPLFN